MGNKTEDKKKKKRSREETNGKEKSPKKTKLVEESTNGHEKKTIDAKSSNGTSSVDPISLIANYRVCKETQDILEKRGIKTFFPIQFNTFDSIYDGKDLIGRARTGTGKTLAFACPIVEKLKSVPLNNTRGRLPKVLVMAPTRELASQTATEFKSIAPQLQTLCIYGGTSYEPQERAMWSGLDIVVGTPGRIMDHLEKQNLVLSDIDFVVLDEADEMLNFGFAEDIEKILGQIPKEKDHQTLLFSATLPTWVDQVAKKYLKKDKVLVDLVGESKQKSSHTIEHLAIGCHWQIRSATLADIVRVYGKDGRTIVFADTKAEATELATTSSIRSICQVLHGDIAQNQREITLQGFKNGKFHCLVATDVAARGLDIPEVDLVVQCQPPKDSETFIHRAGRTGRAGRSGTNITFFSKSQSGLLKLLERRVGIEFRRIGTPQPEDIARMAGEKAIGLIEGVDESMVSFFEDTARKLIAEKGDVKALAATLAQLTGYSQPFKTRSLLSSLEGYTTVRVYTIRPVHSPRFIISLVQDFTYDVKDIKLCEGGAVFDVPTDAAKKIVEYSQDLESKNKGRTLPQKFEYCTVLPELEIEDNGLPPREEKWRTQRRTSGGGGGKFAKANGNGYGRGGSSFSRGSSRGGFRGRG